MFDQIPLDLLSYTLPSNDDNQEFTNTFFSNLNEQNVGSGVMNTAPVPSPAISNFYLSNVEGISPLDASSVSYTALSTPLPTPDYCSPSTHPLQEELEEFLTPLVSPAITPNYTDIYEFLDPPNEQYFTPLSSPALAPEINTTTSSPIKRTSSQSAALLSQQLAQIEAKQQMLRDQLSQSPSLSPKAYRKSPLALFSSRSQAPPSPLPFNNNKKRPSLRQKIALSSPQLQQQQQSSSQHINLPTTPATPASLMKNYQQQQQHAPHPAHNTPMVASGAVQNNSTMTEAMDMIPTLPPAAFSASSATLPVDLSAAMSNKKRKLAPSSPIALASSPRTLKPNISPFLQPDLKTTSSSSAFIPGIENRRSAHKVAEQRRRDTLKQSFDSLRGEIAEVLVADSLTFGESENASEEAIREEKEKEVKLMSKVLLLQHSYEYIVRLKNDGKYKDKKMEQMQKELDALRKLSSNSNKDVK